MKIIIATLFALLVSLFVGDALAGPVPVGSADVTFSYMTDSGLYSTTDSVDFSGTGHDDATPLGGNKNLLYFNSVNVFGRRALVPETIGPEETLLAHAFFKDHGNHAVYFEGILNENTPVTLEVQNIHFEVPGYIQQETALWHKQWDADQADELFESGGSLYINVSNHDTLTDPFRDFKEFFPQVFTDFPEPNYALAAIAGDVEWFGDGTDTIGFKVTYPYSMFKHFEENKDLPVPEDLPAPFGFLEPFHFHFEYLISSIPEPTTALLLGALLPWLVIRRRR